MAHENATPRRWNAERFSSMGRSVWGISYNPTPGGRRNDDGSTTYSLIIPAFHATDFVNDPEQAVKDVADALNSHEALTAEVDALKARLAELEADNERLRWRHPNILPEFNDLPQGLRTALVLIGETYGDQWAGGDFALDFYNEIKSTLDQEARR